MINNRLLFIAAIACLALAASCSTQATPPSQVAPPEISVEYMNSPFGIFGAYALEYSYFQKQAELNNESYWNWVDRHFQDLGAHWTRSNLQLIWDVIEPEIGEGFHWENQLATDRIISRVSVSPANVQWVGVFHEGGKSTDLSKSSLRDPLEYPGEYCQFVKAAVERYDGDGMGDLNPSVRIKYWQIGNEFPAWQRKGNTLSDYIGWVKATSSAIKEADPEARVVMMADTQGFIVSPWLKSAIEELSPAHFIDVVDIHHWGTAGDWKMGAVPVTRSLLNGTGRNDAEIFSCENGTWVGKPDIQPAQSEEEQARSLVKRYVYNLNNGLDKLFWNNLMEWNNFNSQPGNMFNSMGLVSDGRNSGDLPDRFNTVRTAYWSYWLLSHNLGNHIRSGQRMNMDSPDIYFYQFPGSGESDTSYVGWSETGEVNIKIKSPASSLKTIILASGHPGKIESPLTINADEQGVFNIKLGVNPLLIASEISVPQVSK
jgi:hypothetical protein